MSDTEFTTIAPDDEPDDVTDEPVATDEPADPANVLGDQDAVNLAPSAYPPGADVPTAQNVRRYPDLFDQATIDSFNVDLPEQAHEAALREEAEEQE